MPFKFEELQVFLKAVILSNRINDLVQKFPRSEIYNLCSQIRRAADSVVLNIAEGSSTQSAKEFSRFLGIAVRSGVEVAAGLYLAFSRNYIEESEYRSAYSEYEVLCKMLNKFRHTLSGK